MKPGSDNAMSLTLTIILAILLDHSLGETKKHHPLVYFGQLATWLETSLLKQKHSKLKQKIYGLMALLILLLPFSSLVYLVSQWTWINPIISPLILYFCIASNSLKQHSIAVFKALELDDLSLAKKQVAMMVSRETENMTADDIRKASIESVLENGADAIFAPIFWFIIAGPVATVTYRLSNTLDAMWGYKNQRYLHFGWATARFDDILNWFPARLTAISYALSGQTMPAINCWKNQAHLLDSPNAGPVMASGAGALNLQLGGPARYCGKLKNKVFFGTQQNPQNSDINRANSLITCSIYVWLIAVMVLELLGEYFA